jgi:hypothetical protein
MIRLKQLLAEQSVIGAPNQGMVDPKAYTNHDVMMALGIASAFIPVVGLVLSSGIMLGDAAVYKSEGNDYMAGLTTLFAVLPLIGPIARIGTGAIAKLGPRGMSKLGSKLARASKGSKPKLNATEASAVRELSTNNKFIRAELDKYLTSQAKQNSKKLSAWAMRKGALTQATKATLKNPLTKFAATLGLYMGAADVYDYVYWQKYSVKPEQAKAMIDQTQQEILDESLRSLDRMIAAKKRGTQVARVESIGTDKSALTEISPAPAAELLPQLFNMGTIIPAVFVLGGRTALNALLSWGSKLAATAGLETMSTRLNGFRIPGFFKLTDALYRGIKGLFVGQKTAFKGYRLFAVNQKDLEIILSKLKEAQIAEYNKVLGYVRDGHMTANEAMARFSRDANLKQLNSVKDELYNKLEDLAIQAKKAKDAAKAAKKTKKKTTTNTPPPNTGGQQSTANKTTVNQKNVDKYYVPKNMSIDDYDKLTLNTRAYIQQYDLDWTYDQAKRWQNR